MAKEEKYYGLIGYPLIHSFSRTFFNKKFAAESIPARYDNYEIPSIDRLPELLRSNPLLAGLNVTIPYKGQIIPYLDELDPLAARAGAVNVVKFVPSKKGKILDNVRLVGHNSDVAGFSDSIEPLINEKRRKALILGTGGASKAVRVGLENLGVEWRLVSRRKQSGALTYEELTPEIMAEYKVIVNTTPVGMYPHVDECPAIPYEFLTPDHLCYDLIYNPDTTMFMKRAAEHGAETKNGLEMLLLQAFVSWDIWNR